MNVLISLDVKLSCKFNSAFLIDRNYDFFFSFFVRFLSQQNFFSLQNRTLVPFLPLGLEKDIFGWIGICGYREHGGCRRPLHLSFVAQSPEGAITGRPKTTFMHLTTWVMQKHFH